VKSFNIQLNLTVCNDMKYTVGHKNVALYFCPYLCQLLTDCRKNFTGTLGRQFAISLMRLLYVPPHRIWQMYTNFSNCFHCVRYISNSAQKYFTIVFYIICIVA